MAVPSFIYSSSIAYDTSVPYSVTPYMGTHQAGDILIIGAYNSRGYVMTTATEGWTRIDRITGTADFDWYWKRATGSGTAGATITSGSYNLYAIGSVFRGCITTGTPYENATTTSGNTTTPASMEIDTTDIDRLVVCLSIMADNNAWSTSPPPANWTLDSNKNTSGGTDATFTLISKEEASDTTVAAANVGISPAAERWGTLTLALIPAPAAEGTNMQINIGDVWKEVPAIKINIGDVWKDVVSVQQNIGDTWKEVF